MGNQFLDQYSILHFAVGVIAYFWNVSFLMFLVAHVSFEFLENTAMGMRFINRYLTWWPGGKPRADNFVNIAGDNVVAMLGWYTAYKLDLIGKERGWYK